MAFEKSWPTVAPTRLTADGTAEGVVTVADTLGFQVKGLAQLANNAGLTMVVQVNQVLSSTVMIVGKPGSSPSATAGGAATGAVVDVSAFTIATASTIGFGMQPKTKIKPDDIEQSTYQNDPVVAVRTIPVDPYGNLVGPDNPLPVTFDGTISVGKVEIIGPPPDNNPLQVNADGSINVIVEPIPASGSEVVNIYNELIGVAGGFTTFIVSYTVPVGKQAVFQKATFSGENIARYDLFINGTVQDTARTYYSSNYTGEFNFTTGNDSGLLLVAGNTIKVQVNNFRPSSANFESRIQVLEFPA